MQVTFSLFVFQFTLRIKKEFLVFPLTHHATASSDHNIPFYPIQKLPNFNSFLQLALISQSAAVLRIYTVVQLGRLQLLLE